MKVKKILQKLSCKLMSFAVAFAVLAGGVTISPLTARAESSEVTLEPEMLEAVLLEGDILSSGKNVNARTMMVDCIISICFGECYGEPGIHMEISTGTVGDASVLGVKDIKIMKKVWYGWKTVAVSSGGEAYNNSMMGVDIFYDNAEKDETYRVTCTHYADVDGYIEAQNDTGAFLFTY